MTTEGPTPAVKCLVAYDSDGLNYADSLWELLRSYTAFDIKPIRVDCATLAASDWGPLMAPGLYVILVAYTPRLAGSYYLPALIDYLYQRREAKLIPITNSVELAKQSRDKPLSVATWHFEGVEAFGSGSISPSIRKAVFAAIDSFAGVATPFEIMRSRGGTVTRPLNEVKLIVIGRGEVGKTSIVNRVRRNVFRTNEAKTAGIDISPWELYTRSAKITLRIWDFGGQEMMHATHQFFLTKNTLYLLVLNGRSGGEDLDAEYWLKHIESFGGESPVIVVQNKTAAHPFDLNYRGLQLRYPQIRGFVKTDCEIGSGISDLINLMTSVIENMPEVEMPFPSEWFNVKEVLEGYGSDYISYETYQNICRLQGVHGDRDCDALCGILHCLGIALNYRDDPRLREASILKPEWITQGIYRILNAGTLAERQGELDVADLPKLLDSSRYPPGKQLFLMELMRKFNLCFPFSEASDRYLVPDLLGKEEPEETQEFLPSECLNFEYHYGVLPEGLVPRFIVRSHVLSRGKPRWRSGVILGHEGCSALVTALSTERRVSVHISGGSLRTRRSLLAMIRYDFDRMHDEFRDRLDVVARVPLKEYPEYAIDYEKLVACEAAGVKQLTEYVRNKIISIDVNSLLNGVDLESQRDSSRTMSLMTNPRLVFFSYSHKDEGMRDELETHLKLLEREGVISTWHDRRILAGGVLDDEIDHYLNSARIILLLVSADFLASEYCSGKEVSRALIRHHAKEATVIPVILRSCDWRTAPFSHLLALPKDAKPVATWTDRDAAWADVAKGIREVAQAR